MSSIRKAIQDVTKSDLEGLIGQSEDEQTEFKGCVPHEQEADDWAERGDLTKYGCNKILRTIVAFANSYGGDIFIGIRESKGKIGKAEEVTPVPNCVDLAQRLAQRAHDLIDPPLSSLHVRGIPLHDDGSGVVVVRTSQSRLAPHRHEGLKECFQRVRHEIRRMSMRQVQDMTFSVNRGLDRVEQRFTELRHRFERWAQYNQQQTGLKRMCLWVACVPLSADCSLSKVHNVEEVRPGQRTAKFRPNKGAAVTNLNLPFNLYSWKPVLRGSEGTTNDSERLARISVFCDGAITYECRMDVKEAEDVGNLHAMQRTFVLYYEWFFGMIVNAMEAADKFRTVAGASAVEYGLELGIGASHPLPAINVGRQGYTQIRGTLEHGHSWFPKYPIGARDSWPETLTTMWRDFWNSVGATVPDDMVELDPN